MLKEVLLEASIRFSPEASQHTLNVETDINLATITNGVTVTSEGVKEGNLYNHPHEKQQLKP